MIFFSDPEKYEKLYHIYGKTWACVIEEDLGQSCWEVTRKGEYLSSYGKLGQIGPNMASKWLIPN